MFGPTTDAILMLIATVVMAIATAALAVFTAYLAKVTREMALESRRMREQRERADVQLAVEPHPGHIIFLELVIGNVGLATAQDVDIAVTVRAPDASSSRAAMQKSFAIKALLPGSQHRLFIGSSAEIGEHGVVEATAVFRDSAGRHRSELQQPVGGWFGFSRIGEHPAYEAAAQLKKIANVLDGWNGFRRVNVNVFTSEDRRDAEVEEYKRIEQFRAERAVGQSAQEP